MIIFPNAKINLGLNVLFKRADGYHEIDSCMMPIPWSDVLEILPASTFEYKQTGLEINCMPSDNLVVKAYELMRSKHNIPPVYIHLIKNIPSGSGLGGGSSNASFTLLGLNKLFNLSIPKKQLLEYAEELGSDCPFFIENKPKFVSGKGEVLKASKLNLEGYYIKTVFPELAISTQVAFSSVKLNANQETVESVIGKPITEWSSYLKNDFEASAFKIHPQLKEIKLKMINEGAVYASMSGSGSSIFGIYQTLPTASFPEFKEKIFKL